MKTKEYFAPLIKWWWLLVLAALIAGGSAYLATRPLPPVYMARTSLVIGNFITSLNPTQDELYLAQQLAQTYSNIASREPVRLATMQSLGLSSLPPYSARPLSNGPFMEITVTYSDPKVAAVVANELAKQLILISPSNIGETDTEQRDFIEQQLKDVELRIKKTQEEIAIKQQDLAGMTSAVQINQTQSELAALDSRMTLLQQTYANLQASLPDSGRNVLRIYETADPPSRPIGPNKLLIIGLTALAGLIAAILAAYGIEALDNTVRSPSEATQVLSLPVIGRISSVPSGRKNWAYVEEQPQSALAEDFLLLRTNLEFFGVDQPLRTYMVSSADVGDGKSTVAINLALVMAQGDKKVILVDADFRRPMIAQALELGEDHEGLSDVISHGLALEEALVDWKGNPCLQILTAGTQPPNPAELLSSKRMVRVLDELKQMADIIILDGPPFIIADASILAPQVDGLLVVVRPGHSRRAAVIAMRDQIKRFQEHVLGMVLNQSSAPMSYYSSKYRSKASKKKQPVAAPEPQGGTGSVGD